MENSVTEAPVETLPVALTDARIVFGASLRSARETAGKSLRELAMILKLGEKQLASLEAGAWDELPGPTFIRGVVRNYARMVGMEEAQVASSLNQLVDRPSTVLNVPESNPAKIPYTISNRRKDRTVMVLGASLVVLALLAYVFLQADMEDIRGRLQGGLDRFSKKEVVEETANGDAPATTVPPEQVFPPGVTPQQVLTPQAQSPEALQVPAVSPEEKKPVVETPNPVTQEKSATVSDAVVPVDPKLTNLSFTVEKSAWIEVKDRNDKIVFSQRLPSGVTQSVSGQGPLYLVIGYAPGVKLTWRGQPVNLEPHTRGDVARLVLE